MTTELYQKMIEAQRLENEDNDTNPNGARIELINAAIAAENAYYKAREAARYAWCSYPASDEVKDSAIENANETCGPEGDPNTDMLWWYQIAKMTAHLDPNNV